MALTVLRQAGPRTVHCELDDWDFNPRLTDGACPICGWKPEGAVPPAPAWVQVLQKVQWDFVLLFVLAAVLFTLGIQVAQAAHLFGGH